MIYDSELVEAATEIVQSVSPAEASAIDRPLWQLLEQSGLTLVSLPEALGGSGGTLLDAAAVVETTAWAGAQLPIAESTLLVSWLLEEAGLEATAGVATAAASADIHIDETPGAFTLTGTLTAVPWGADADTIVVAADVGERCLVAVLTAAERPRLRVTAGRNLAGEARDSVELQSVTVPATQAVFVDHPLGAEFLLRGALACTIQISGAARAALELTSDYVAMRQQFGRPLAAFQAVQQQLACMAAEVALMKVAAQSAASAALESSEQFAFSVACAKAAVSSAVRTVTATAHQLHGAMGVTAEYPLGRATLRMWSWRDEFGDDGFWSEMVARGAGADAWAALTLADTLRTNDSSEARS